MRKFFFHLHDDIDVPDLEGKELPNLEAAREWALWEARDVFCHTARNHGRVVLGHRIDIEDERGRVLTAVHFGDAVKVEA